jgi:hypothetical protein
MSTAGQRPNGLRLRYACDRDGDDGLAPRGHLESAYACGIRAYSSGVAGWVGMYVLGLWTLIFVTFVTGETD